MFESFLRGAATNRRYRNVTVSTAFRLNRPVSATKTKHRNKLEPEADLQLQLSSVVPDLKSYAFMKTASSVTLGN